MKIQEEMTQEEWEIIAYGLAQGKIMLAGWAVTLLSDLPAVSGGERPQKNGGRGKDRICAQDPDYSVWGVHSFVDWGIF